MKKASIAVIMGFLLSGCSIINSITSYSKAQKQIEEARQRQIALEEERERKKQEELEREMQRQAEIREKERLEQERIKQEEERAYYELTHTIYKPKNKAELIPLLKNTHIPLENIDVSEMRDFSYLFDSTYGREDFKGLEKWNPGNATKMHFMFSSKEFKSYPEWYMNFVKKHPTFTPKTREELDRILRDEEKVNYAEIDVSKVDGLSYLFSDLQPEDLPMNGSPSDKTEDIVLKMMSFSFVSAIARERIIVGIDNWDISNATKLDGMFSGFAGKLYSDISRWNPKKAKSMKNAFFMSSVKYPDWYIKFVKKYPTYTPKNKDELIAIIDGKNVKSSSLQAVSLIEIDVSKLNDLSYIFCYAEGIKGCRKHSKKVMLSFIGIELWNVSNVRNMERMFMGSDFDRNISGWNVSNVLNFYETFARTPFSQDISSWKINKKARLEKMFFDSELEKQEKLPIWAE